MAEPSCHYCGRTAVEECHQCGRLFCDDHGEEICLRCLSPEASTPSPLVYRGVLLALGVASAAAIYLAVDPPARASTQDSVRVVPTATASAAPPSRTATTGTPATGTTPRTAAPGSTATPSPSANATPGGSGQPTSYTVAPGDTLGAIASRFNTTVEAIEALNPGLDERALQVGQQLQIPAQR